MNGRNQPSLPSVGDPNEMHITNERRELIRDYQPYIRRAHQLRREEMDRCFSLLWRWFSSPFSRWFRISSWQTTPDVVASHRLDEPEYMGQGK